MAASPGRSYSSNQRQTEEVKYINRLRDIPIRELFQIISFSLATDISNRADGNIDFSDVVDEKNEARYNTGIYDDEAEDYIFNQAVEDLVDKSRKQGKHEDAERVRLLRSARAIIYYTLKHKEQ